jgi:replication initiation protein RepC
MYIGLVGRLPRTPVTGNLQALLQEMEMLHSEILNLVEMHMNSEKMNTNDVGFDRHIQNSNTESIHEVEPRSGKEQGAKPEVKPQPKRRPIKAFRWAWYCRLVRRSRYRARTGQISSWRGSRGLIDAWRRPERLSGRLRPWDQKMGPLSWRVLSKGQGTSIRPAAICAI